MKLKLFTVTLLGLAVATTVALSGCATEEQTTVPEGTDVNVETPMAPEAVEGTDVNVESTTTNVPAEAGTTEEAPATTEEGAAEAPAESH